MAGTRVPGGILRRPGGDALHLVEEESGGVGGSRGVDVRYHAKRWLLRLNTAVAEQLSVNRNGQPQQLLLAQTYRHGLHTAPGVLPPFDAVGFRTYSQTDEDGKILYILSLIGDGSRRCVDLGFNKPMGANTTNLIVNWGWQGLGVEANAASVRQSDLWFRRNRSTMFDPPRIVNEWISPDNLAALLQRESFDSDVDLVSIDVDSVDYWLWNALPVRPRVVVVECNPIWDADVSVTVPASTEFRDGAAWPRWYGGASMRAMVRLGDRLGYRFVGVNALGVNAFFVRNDVIPDGVLPEASVEECLQKPWARRVRLAPLDEARNAAWETV